MAALAPRRLPGHLSQQLFLLSRLHPSSIDPSPSLARPENDRVHRVPEGAPARTGQERRDRPAPRSPRAGLARPGQGGPRRGRLPFFRAPRHRLGGGLFGPPVEPGARAEPKKTPSRRVDTHAAAREEPVAHGRTHLVAEGARGGPRRRSRPPRAESADSRDLSFGNRVRRDDLWLRSGVTRALRRERESPLVSRSGASRGPDPGSRVVPRASGGVGAPRRAHRATHGKPAAARGADDTRALESPR